MLCLGTFPQENEESRWFDHEFKVDVRLALVIEV